MPANDLRLLSLDGGGVRGLSALMILQQLMETIDPVNPPKPCDYFDMIGGTNTGGLIAIMLGRLRMSVDECIDAFLALSDRIFQKKRHRATVKGGIEGRFDAEELARAVKEVVVAQGLPEDALLKDVSDGACKVFVCATSQETSETVWLTSYSSLGGTNDLLNSVKIWEACRATFAPSSFFDSITIDRYGEGFVDGATGANNPVREVWNQAQLLWGPQPLEGKITCLVSIGTGVPPLKPFQHDAFHIGKTLFSIATETEQTAERFRQDKTHLDDEGRYYRFNVNRGLEEVGLEESKKWKEIAAATRLYIKSTEAFKQMKACADNMTGRGNFGEYRVEFSLQNVPRVSKFVERPAEMAELERVLLPKRHLYQQKRFVLHGLGGIGKTQLAVEFVSQHQRRFSAVFWLDGRSKNSVIQSIASCARRIPDGQISQSSKTYAAGETGDINAVVQEVMLWLAREHNDKWLLIFDNVNRDYSRYTSDSDAYDVKQYFSGMNHGSILITTRLAKLEQLGDSRRLGKVTLDQARAILRSRYKGDNDPAEDDRLLSILDGLPLAIAQAAAFLQETGTEPREYLEFYKQKWKVLMKSDEREGAPLQDYPDRSVWTTWTISYEMIRKTHKAAANLLLLWAFLDRKDLWYGLFRAACEASETVASRLSEWVGSIASDELDFTKGMRILRNYSMIEEAKESGSYGIHPVVHQWAYHFQEASSRAKLAQLAVMVVGWAVPSSSSQDFTALQRRLLPHAQACSLWVGTNESELHSGKGGNREDQEVVGQTTSIYDAIYLLGNLYKNQSKLGEAETMYQQALLSFEKALGADHPSTLNTVNSLGILYASQGNLVKAEEMYQRALLGYEKARGSEHILTLRTVGNLGILYADQGKLVEAEKMYQRALQGYEKAWGPDHPSTLQTINNLGTLYASQGKLDLAEPMYQRALRSSEKVLGKEHPDTLASMANLASTFWNQGRWDAAEELFVRVMETSKKKLGADHPDTLASMVKLASTYRNQGRWDAGIELDPQVLEKSEKILGADHLDKLASIANLALTYRNQGRQKKVEDFDEASTTFTDHRSAFWSDQARSTNPSSMSHVGVDMEQVISSRLPMTFYRYKPSADELNLDEIDIDIQSVESTPGDIDSLAETTSEMMHYQEAIVKYVVKVFVDELDLLALYQEATHRMSEAKFVENNRRLLKRLFFDLRDEEYGVSQNLATRFFRSRIKRTQISSEICRLLMPSDYTVRDKILMLKEEQGNLSLIDRFLVERDPAAQEALTSGEPLFQPQIRDERSEESEEDKNVEDMSSDESETEFEDIKVPPNLAEAAGFLISGRPFRLYKENLRAFIRPVTPAPKSDHNSLSSVQVTRTEGSGLVNLDYDVINSIGFISSIQDICKTGIEHLAGCQLSWWPLAEPEDELRPNQVRVYSMLFRGRRFYDDIPTPLAKSLFPKLLCRRTSTPECNGRFLGREAVLLHNTTLMRLLLIQFTSKLNRDSAEQDENGTREHTPSAAKPPSGSSSNQHGEVSQMTGEASTTISLHASRTKKKPKKRKRPKAGIVSDAIDSPFDEDSQESPVLFLSVNTGLNESIARTIVPGITDKATFRSLYDAYRSIPSRWPRFKRATGIKFYRFHSFLFKETPCFHYVDIHSDKERYPAEDDPEFEDYYYRPRPWPSGTPFPSHEVWHYFKHPEDCGTSTDLKEMLPTRSKGPIGSRSRAFSVYIEERYSALAIFIPAALMFLLILGATLWFIPSWLKEHPGDLQNATVPIIVAFTVGGFYIQLIVSLLVFRWTNV